MPLTLEITSGTCSTSVSLKLEASSLLINDFIKQTKNELIAKETSKKCKDEVNQPSIRASYINQYLCVIEKCDNLSNEKAKKEKKVGEKSGFVNKALLYGLAKYQEQSAIERKKISNALIKLKTKNICSKQLKDKDVAFFINGNGQYHCGTVISASSISKNACFINLFRDTNEPSKGSEVSLTMGLIDPIEIATNGWGRIEQFAKEVQSNNQEVDPDMMIEQRKIEKELELAVWTLRENNSKGTKSLINDEANRERTKKLVEEKNDRVANLNELHQEKKMNNNKLEAFQILEKLYKEQPNDLGTIFEYVNGLKDIGKYAKGISVLNDVKMDGQDDVQKNIMIAGLAHQMGDKETTYAALEKVLILSQNSDAYDIYIQYAISNKDVEKVNGLIKLANEKFPKMERVLAMSSVELDYKMGNFESSVNKLKKLIEKNSEDYEALNSLAYVLAKSNGNLQQAQDYIDNASKLHPGSGYLIRTEGYILMKQGKLQEALKKLKKSVQLIPTNFEATHDLAEGYELAGAQKEAIEYYKKALELADGKDQRLALQQKIDLLEQKPILPPKVQK